MLTQTLRKLERDGLVSRTVVPTVPISVTYALTDLGRSFVEPAQNMLRWAERSRTEIGRARQQYDAQAES